MYFFLWLFLDCSLFLLISAIFTTMDLYLTFFLSTLLTIGRVLDSVLTCVCFISFGNFSRGISSDIDMSPNTALISLPLFWEFHYTYVFTIAHMSFRHFSVFLMFSCLHYSIKHFPVTSIHHFSLLLYLMCSVKHLLRFLTSGVFFFPPPVLEFQSDFLKSKSKFSSDPWPLFFISAGPMKSMKTLNSSHLTFNLYFGHTLAPSLLQISKCPRKKVLQNDLILLNPNFSIISFLDQDFDMIYKNSSLTLRSQIFFYVFVTDF